MGSETISHERLLNQERLILRATEAIWEQMHRRGIRKTDLAEKLGLSRARITQALDGESNLTLRTLADLASALDCEVVLALAPSEFDERSLFLEQTTMIMGRPSPSYTFDAKDEKIVKTNHPVAA